MGPRNGLFGGDRGSYGKGTFILKSEHEKLLTPGGRKKILSTHERLQTKQTYTQL